MAPIIPIECAISIGNIQSQNIVVDKTYGDWAKTMGFKKGGCTYLFAEEAYYLLEKRLLQIKAIDCFGFIKNMLSIDPLFNVRRLQAYLMLKQKEYIVQRADEGFTIWKDEQSFQNSEGTKIIFPTEFSLSILDKCKNEKIALLCIEGTDMSILSIK